MYYGNTQLVPIPKTSEKGKIVVTGTGYVYIQTSYTWDPVKRQPHYERKAIGKRDPRNPDMMYYSKEYEAIFGVVDIEVVELRKIYGKRELQVAGRLNYSISFGPYVVIEAACRRAGCLEPLKRVFSSEWRLILGLCVHAIVEEKTTSQSFPGWCFLNYCGMNRVVADTEISKLYKSISDKMGDVNVFFSLYWKDYSIKFPDSGMRAVGFDSTNQNYYGDGIPWAKLGHAKINIGTPIINTAMFVDEATGIPLWYEHFDGSVLDKTQTPFSLKKVLNMGFRKLFVIYDRGYYSEETVTEIEKLKDIEFGILCPEGTNWVDDLIRSKGSEIKDKQMHYIPSENVYGDVYEVQPFIENKNDKIYYAYLFYDSERASAERDTIHEVVAYFWEQASARTRYTEKMADTFAKQGIIVVKTDKDEKTGKNFQLYEDTDMIQGLLDMKGFFVMISASKINPVEAIRIIRKRDMSEKGFALMMNHFNLRTTGRMKKETYEGMMFMAFIALICLSSFMYFERSYLRDLSSRTTAVVMAELKKYQIVWNDKEGVWEPGYAMNKDQKQVYQNMNLTEADVQKMITSIDAKYTHSQ